LPENIAATEYEHLRLTSSISGFPIVCHRELNSFTFIFYQDNECLDSDDTNADYRSNCEITGSFIIFNITLLSPLRNNVNYGISCFHPENVYASVTIQVQGIQYHM